MQTKYIVKQNDTRDCGICCLESIIKYYNGYIPLEILRLDTNTNNNGTTAYNLIKTAKKYGFNALGKKINKLNEKEIILPAIAHITTKKGLNHFVVIYKINKNTVTIMDPAKGFIKLKKEEFQKEWNNIILIMKPFKKLPLYKIKNNLKELLIELLIKEKSLIIKIFLNSIIITIISIILSYHLKISISTLEQSSKNVIIMITIIFFIINILKIYYTALKNNLSIYLNKNINLRLIPDFINHIINLPLNVIKSRTTGEILTRVQELNNIKNLFTEVLIYVILDILLVLTSSIFLYHINKELFFILCIISLLLIITGIIINPILNRKINDNIDLETEFNSTISETIDSLESIKNLNLVSKKYQSLEDTYTNYEENTFYLSKYLNIIETINSIIYDIGLFIITSYSIYLITLNKLSILELITFNSLISYFINPIKEIISLMPKYYHISLSYNKVLEFLNISNEVIKKETPFINGDISFSNISYSYNNYKKIINNYSLHIKEKSHVLVKGNTGIGKSTLFKMLNHNIDQYTGNIYIGDINIKDYSLSTLRNNILYVSQRESIFSDTIYNNITLNRKISVSKLNEVLKITKVDEIINKKELRLDTFLYDSGQNLSGGERQRIILARSIIYNPKILILDESLSEVDNITEKEILSSIDKYLINTTIIYISHSNTNYFKNIINMEQPNV